MDEENNVPEMDEELDNIVILNDEDGKEVRFEFLDLIEYEDEEYVILLPTDEDEDSGEVVILQVEDTDSEEEESYVSVDDEETLNAVFEIFKEKFKDEFNFILKQVYKKTNKLLFLNVLIIFVIVVSQNVHKKLLGQHSSRFLLNHF